MHDRIRLHEGTDRDASWKYAEMMVDLYLKIGLFQSKLFGYETPPKEDGWFK